MIFFFFMFSDFWAHCITVYRYICIYKVGDYPFSIIFNFFPGSEQTDPGMEKYFKHL